jgi:hypothetical protein
VERAGGDGPDGASPYCQVVVDGDWMRVEAVSNEILEAQHLLDEEQEEVLIGLGFGAPEEGRSPNFWVDIEQREADRAAWMMVRALHEVFGVAHPVYLEAEGLEPAAESIAPPALEAAGVDESVREPQGSDELRQWLFELVADVTGGAEIDDDGDVPFVTEKTVFYITVSQGAARILIHATLLTDVVDEERALVEVNLLNRAEFGVTFVLVDGSVSVRRELPMGAFVPADARMEIHRLQTDADRWITELQDRCGGRTLVESETRPPRDRRTVPAEPDDERFAKALKVLRELESEERGSVDVATFGRIFHSDRDLLLQASATTTSSAVAFEPRCAAWFGPRRSRSGTRSSRCSPRTRPAHDPPRPREAAVRLPRRGRRYATWAV